jgi:hypothetical protein
MYPHDLIVSEPYCDGDSLALLLIDVLIVFRLSLWSVGVARIVLQTVLSLQIV